MYLKSKSKVSFILFVTHFVCVCVCMGGGGLGSRALSDDEMWRSNSDTCTSR